MDYKALTWNAELAFLKSALTEDNKFIDTTEVLGWIQKRNKEVSVSLQRIQFKDMQNWFIEDNKYNMQYITGRFF